GRGQVGRAGIAVGGRLRSDRLRGGRLRGGQRGQRGRRDGGNLVQQVDELLDRADEVAGGQIGILVQDALQPRAARPAVGGPGEAEVWFAQERQVVVLLQLVELAPGADGGGERL